jgi:hypothetical protein
MLVKFPFRITRNRNPSRMSSPHSFNAGNTSAVGAIVSDHSQLASAERLVDIAVVGIAGEIWSQFVY